MQPPKVALFVTLVPIFTANLVYLLSAGAGHVPTCIPYIEGCTSISRAGRSGDSIFIFRAAMICNAVFLLWYWRLSQLWLLQFESRPASRYRVMLWLGCIGAVFLILYADFLGTRGEMYRFMRRYGIIFFFSFTPLAQMILLKGVFRLCEQQKLILRCRWVPLFQLWLCVGMLGLGVLSVVLDYIGLKTDAVENVIEWNFALLMFCYFGGSYWLWKETGFRVGVLVG